MFFWRYNWISWGSRRNIKGKRKVCLGQVQRIISTSTARGASLKINGKLYTSCVQNVMMLGSETRAMKFDDVQCLERTEKMMIR